MTKRESIIVLLSITLCWSSSYLFIKEVPEGCLGARVRHCRRAYFIYASRKQTCPS